MLCRLSDSFILAQIYLKLPVFWKNLIQASYKKAAAAPVVARSHEVVSKPIGFDDVGAKLDDVRSLLKRIENGGGGGGSSSSSVSSQGLASSTALAKVSNSGGGGSGKVVPIGKGKGTAETKTPFLKKLAPKLPFLVPQLFDKNPYVSLNDGRKLDFCGNVIGLYAKNASKKVHRYNFKFWPIMPSKNEPFDNSLYDENAFGFDVLENNRQPLSCELCNSGLRLISCKTCNRGFCFLCAFRYRHVSHSQSELIFV